MNPKVSVIMAVYNGADFLREAVDSILDQTFTDFEFLIIDDGSIDDTPAILSEYARSDARVVVFTNDQNIGLTRSLNIGLQAAQGDYVARQDADDISLPTRLERETEFLDAHPDGILVSGNIQYVDEAGHAFMDTALQDDPRIIAWKLLFYNHIAGHSLVMFRRAPVMALGGYAEDYRTSQDYELWLRLTQVGEMHILPDVLLLHRVHASAVSVQKKSEQEADSLAASGRALSQLLPDHLTRADVAELRGFWTERTPDIRALSRINARLTGLFDAFLRRYQAEAETASLNQTLRLVIAERYLLWARRFGGMCRPLAVLRLVAYALAWYPRGVHWQHRARVAGRHLWLMRRCPVRLIPQPARRALKRFLRLQRAE